MEQGYDGTTEASSNEEQGIAGKGMSINSSTSNDSTSNDSTNNNNTNNYINNGSSIDNSIQEVDANAYNSEDFDDQSTMDMKNGNEGEVYTSRLRWYYNLQLPRSEFIVPLQLEKIVSIENGFLLRN